MDVGFSSLFVFVNAVLFCFINSELRKDLLGSLPSFDNRAGSGFVNRPGRSNDNEIKSEGDKKNYEVEMLSKVDRNEIIQL